METRGSGSVAAAGEKPQPGAAPDLGCCAYAPLIVLSCFALPFNFHSGILGLVAACAAKGTAPNYGSVRTLSVLSAVFAGLGFAVYLILFILYSFTGSINAILGAVLPSVVGIPQMKCSSTCPIRYIRDGICDAYHWEEEDHLNDCHSEACGFDLDDCAKEGPKLDGEGHVYYSQGPLLDRNGETGLVVWSLCLAIQFAQMICASLLACRAKAAQSLLQA